MNLVKEWPKKKLIFLETFHFFKVLPPITRLAISKWRPHKSHYSFYLVLYFVPTDKHMFGPHEIFLLSPFSWLAKLIWSNYYLQHGSMNISQFIVVVGWSVTRNPDRNFKIRTETENYRVFKTRTEPKP